MKHRNGIFEKLSEKSELLEYKIKLLQVIDDYLGYYDLFNITNEQAIFRMLYQQGKSNIAVQLQGNISKSTLDRYIKKYDYMARTLIINDCDFVEIKKSLQL